MKAVVDGYDVPIRSVIEDEKGILGIIVRMNHRTFAIWHPNAFYNYWHDTDGEPYKVELPKEVNYERA